MTDSAVIQTDTRSTEMKGVKDIVLFLGSNNAQETTSAVRWQIGSDARPKKKKKKTNILLGLLVSSSTCSLWVLVTFSLGLAWLAHPHAWPHSLLCIK